MWADDQNCPGFGCSSSHPYSKAIKEAMGNGRKDIGQKPPIPKGICKS